MDAREFYQQGPSLFVPNLEQSTLRESLNLVLPKALMDDALPELQRFAAKVADVVRPLGHDAEANPPRHVPFDPWGRRIDRIVTSPSWAALADFSAIEGLVSVAYERPCAEHSRVLQFAKLFLFHADSAFFSCPLAMTDGAARAIELYGSPEHRQRFMKHLISRDPKEFWTSGQWMTERTGGSDVSGTSTLAKLSGNGSYTLLGTKWFTSATTSQMAMALARTEGSPPGSKGLSLFCVKVHDDQGGLNAIEVHRLKDKLGTRALPTAELSLRGTPAEMVGEPGQGVKKIASMINITRLHNSVCALSATARALDLAMDYTQKRQAFGAALAHWPLHMATLQPWILAQEAWLQILFRLVAILGKEETTGATTQESATLRIMTPVIKAITAKVCLAATSEVIESFGGAGYIEDTGLPRLLRDAQVFSIWEGTTNVLALDLLRCIEKEQAFPHFVDHVQSMLRGGDQGHLTQEAESISGSIRALEGALQAEQGSGDLVAHARDFLMATGHVFSAASLVSAARQQPGGKATTQAQQWCRMPQNWSLSWAGIAT